VIAVSIVVGVSNDAAAQLKGHYIPGFTGLQNGSQPPPSITLAVPVYVYPTDTIKNDDGETIGANPQINVSFTSVSVVWVTNVKFLGANLGGQALPAAFIRSRIEGNLLDVPGTLEFTDITVQPLWLGWHTTRADFTAGWSFFSPTGKWELGGDDNSGLGMWSNDFQGGTTVRLDSKREWATSLLATYEIHSDKNDVELKVGDILTLEGGTGRAFYHKVDGTPVPRITNLGVVYYAQFKVTSDQGIGPIIDRLLAGDKDRVFAIGAEANIFLPKPKLLLGARVIPEFGARNRTQGLTMLLTIGWQAKSLVRAPAQP
jgi:hypothetical protein